MTKKGDISDARILITNDDGIDAEGIRVLEQIALSVCKNVMVVAPVVQQSGTGHSFTLHRPMRVDKRDDTHYAVDGTPTDCVLYACRCLMKNKQPDLVLSGINLGMNAGSDILYSGTVGAAIEGALLGIRSVAFSMCGVDFSVPSSWQTPLAVGADVLKKLYAAEWSEKTVMNVNFPDIKPEKLRGIAVVSLGNSKIGNKLYPEKNYAGRDFFWISPEREFHDKKNASTDIGALFRGDTVTVTPVALPSTDETALATLKKIF